MDGRASERSRSNRSIVGVLDGVSSEAIVVHRERCAKVRNRNVACLKCADACTSGCIALVDGELRVDAAKCIGCGTCATVCPTSALEARNPSDAQLAQACLGARVGDEVVVACEQLRRAAGGLLDEGHVANVVCLGRVDESLTSGLAVEGVRRIRLACGDCSRCEQEHGVATARLVAATSNACSKPGEAMLGCRWSKACLPAPVSRALALMGQRLPWRRTSLSAAATSTWRFRRLFLRLRLPLRFRALRRTARCPISFPIGARRCWTIWRSWASPYCPALRRACGVAW